MFTSNEEQWFKLAPGVEVSDDQRGLTFLDTSRGKIFVGNRVATLIWQGASRGWSRSRTVEEIAARFRIARGLAERDLRAFLDRLEQTGLVLRKEER